jgi:UDP-N-acetylglucosamine 2-epimerase (non-hydrolysing)
LHRPSNVDTVSGLKGIVESLSEISGSLPVVFPVHPRTRKNLEGFGLWKKSAKKSGLLLTEPLGYLQFISLMDQARMVLTDSGGVQEETTVLGVPCLTLRDETERPVTVEVGTNILIGSDPKRIVREARKILKGGGKKGRIPPLWDGKAAIRIVKVLERWLEGRESKTSK